MFLNTLHSLATKLMGYIINEKKKIKIYKQVLKGTFSDEISKEMESL